MREFKFEAWYRKNDEKDFFRGIVKAVNTKTAEKEIRKSDRSIYKVDLYI